MKRKRQITPADEEERTATEILVKFAETVGLGDTEIIRQFKRQIGRRPPG